MREREGRPGEAVSLLQPCFLRHLKPEKTVMFSVHMGWDACFGDVAAFSETGR